MYLKQYQLLRCNWKTYFDFFSLKKTDHKDLSPFKLSYNKALFELLFKDQRSRLDRGKSKYEEVANKLFESVEKEHFVRNKKGISLDSMIGSIKESEVITGIHLQTIGNHQYPILMVKCYVSSLTLNEDEIVFISTALPCHVDADSSSFTVDVAHIPIMKKSTTQKETKIFKWAMRKATEQIEIYYCSVFSKPIKKLPIKTKILNTIEDIQIKYLM